jgi:hypothetical protein
MPGARKTFATGDEFFASTAVKPLFDYEQTFFGRSGEIMQLNAFLENDNAAVCIFSGRGGIGKTKLVKHWVSTLSAWTVHFLKDDAIWHVESDREVPFDPTIIVADDAHRIDDMTPLLGVVTALRANRRVKLVMAARPSGLNYVNAELIRKFDDSEIVRPKALEELSVKDARALAEEVIGPGYQMHAPALVEVSRDTPLVTVVGGRLIARGQVSPAVIRGLANRFKITMDRCQNHRGSRAFGGHCASPAFAT